MEEKAWKPKHKQKIYKPKMKSSGEKKKKKNISEVLLPPYAEQAIYCQEIPLVFKKILQN